MTHTIFTLALWALSDDADHLLLLGSPLFLLRVSHSILQSATTDIHNNQVQAVYHLGMSERGVSRCTLEHNKKEKNNMFRLLARKRWLAVAVPFVLLLVMLSPMLSTQAAVARPADRPKANQFFSGEGWYKNNAAKRFAMDLLLTKVTPSGKIEGALAEPTYGNEEVFIEGKILNNGGDGNKIAFITTNKVLRSPAEGKGILIGCRFYGTILIGTGGRVLRGKWYWPNTKPNTGDSDTATNNAGLFELTER
jgi:hypothetical protein